MRRRSCSLLLVLLSACADKSPSYYPDSGTPEPHESTPPDTVAPDTVDTGESAPPVETGETADSAPPIETAEPTVTEESVEGTGDDAAGWLFSDDEVHLIELTFPDSTADALTSSPYSYAPAEITIDGMTVPDVAIRLKGKIGSYRSLATKAAFKVDFDHYVEGQSFYGLTKLNLNNMVVDCSMIKEHLSYRAFRDMGLAAERTGYAWVTVNGESYGLYNILEQPNKALLKRHYEDPDGRLYDGKYIWYGGYSYTLLDLHPDLAPLYPLEEGEDVDNLDLISIAAALASSSTSADFYTEMADYIDWDEVLTYWSVEQWVGHNDGYVLNRNNNFVYITADTALLHFLPWDMDYSMLNDSDWGMNWASPYGLLAHTCRNDATCLAAWAEKAGEVAETLDPTVYDEYALSQIALISDYVSADPRKECSTASAAYYQDYVRAFVAARGDYMKSFWGIP